MQNSLTSRRRFILLSLLALLCCGLTSAPLRAQSCPSGMYPITTWGTTSDANHGQHNVICQDPNGAIAIQPQSVNNIYFSDRFPGASAGAKLAACIAALPSYGGTCRTPDAGGIVSQDLWAGVTKPVILVVTGNGNRPLTFTATQNPSAYSSVIGETWRSTIAVNFAGDLFNAGHSFTLENLQIDIFPTAGDRTGASIVVANSIGIMRHIRFHGDATVLTNNGILFKSTGCLATGGMWSLEDILSTNPSTWRDLFLISCATPTAANFTLRDVSANHMQFTDAGIALDGGLDTVQMVNLSICAEAGTAGPTLWLRNTVGARGEYPRWVRAVNVSLEAAGQTCIQVDASKEFQFEGFIASCNTGISVGSTVLNTNIHDTTFVNIAESAITYAGSGAINIHDNSFQDSGIAAHNTYDTISIAAGATDFNISNNYWRTAGRNKPRYGINVNAGAGNRYTIHSNNLAYGTFGTAPINDGGRGAKKAISDNLP